ncbi:hypothetical protein JCM10212_003668 [Sporobolomyces blumeae]
MTFSPRERPHTVNLSFTDADLTDTYRDERETHSSVSSPGPGRHARGDSPVSVRSRRVGPGRGGSEGDGESSAWSVERWSASNGSGRTRDEGDLSEGERSRVRRSNLDRLLDYLDDEHRTNTAASRSTIHPGESDRIKRSFVTSTPPPSVAHTARPPPPSTTALRQRPMTNGPSVDRDGADGSFSGRTPTTYAKHASYRTDAQRLQSTGASIHTRRNVSVIASAGARGVMDDLPDSPSPRPGSVAAMRSGERSAFVDDVSHVRNEAETDPNKGVGGDQADNEDVEAGSIDSIERVAQAALEEFEDGDTRDNSKSSRSPSRFEEVLSPEDNNQDDEQSMRGGDADPLNGEISVGQDLDLLHVETDAHRLNVQLVAELREAQDYIAYLQDELRSISDVVVQLRHVPEDLVSIEGDADLSARETRPSQRAAKTAEQTSTEEVGQASQAAFDVVKHLVALLPSLSVSTDHAQAASGTAPPAPTIDSLALALDFTRSMDTLVHGQGRRRDEDVFTADNVRMVERRLRATESRAGHEHGGT